MDFSGSSINYFWIVYWTKILTTVIVTIGIYFLTKVNDDIKNKNEKVEDTVEWIREKLNSVFNCTIKQDKQAEYLHTFKYVDNKIVVLKKLSEHLGKNTSYCNLLCQNCSEPLMMR